MVAKANFHRPSEDTPEERVEDISSVLVNRFNGMDLPTAEHFAKKGVQLDIQNKTAEGAISDNCRPRDLLNALALASVHYRYIPG